MTNKFRIQETGAVVNRRGLLKAFPNVSFPSTIVQETLDGFAADCVHPDARPSYGQYQTVSLAEPSQKDDGLWYDNWVVSDLYSDTTVDGVTTTKAQHEAAYEAEQTANVASRVRSERDTLLAETDWTGMSDVTMASAMTTYRQALRDITAHADFPNLDDDDWPTKP